MKKVLLLFQTIGFSFGFGQDYVPMLEDNMLWCEVRSFYNFETNEMDFNEHQFQLTEEILNVNGTEYRNVIRRSRNGSESIPMGDWFGWFPDFYLAENISEKKVYIYYPEDNMAAHEPGEFLLYDFNLELGEEISLEGFDIYDNNAYLTQITYEDVFDRENVKTWRGHFEWDDWGDYDFKIYEGIGASTGLNFVSFISQLTSELTCYREAMSTNEMTRAEIKVYPNPFTDYISLDNNYLIKQYQLFDLSGKEILKKSSLDELNSELGELNPGTYILKIITENNRIESFKLIKK